MSDVGNANPAAGSTTGAPPNTPPAGTGGAATEYHTTFEGDLGEYIKTKGFKDAASLGNGYRELEKLVGVKDRLVQLPADDKPESWAPVFERLGRPKDPSAYGLDKIEGADPEFAKVASEMLHQSDILPSQAKKLAPLWDKYVKDKLQGQSDAEAVAFKAEQTKLKEAWGEKHDERFNNAKVAAKALGMTADQVEALEKQVGFSAVMQHFDRLHSDYGIGKEAGFPGGKGGSPTGANGVDQAKQQIETLKNDPAFGKRLQEKEPTALAQWDNLHKQAYPA